MFAQQDKSKNATLARTPETEEQNFRSKMMATQLIVNGNYHQATKVYQPTDITPATENGSSKWADLLARLSQVFWRVSFEIEPVVGGLFSPFTAKIRHCRELSGRDKAELESLMKKR